MADPRSTRLVIGADHLGLDLKAALRDHLTGKGWSVTDIGVGDASPVDYPDVGQNLAERVAAGEFDRGILVCGTGAGMAITANKVPGVRAVCVADPYTAERAIASNNAQVVTFGQLITGPAVAKMLADIWLSNDFAGGRSAPKVAKMDALDRKYRTAGWGTGVDGAGEPAIRREAEPRPAEPPGPAPDRERQLATRAAWAYYVEGLTQAEVARRLGLTRVRVNRLLAQAREAGIVQIRITSKLADCVALEAGLVRRFGIQNAVVVPTPGDPALVPQAIAAEAGRALSERIRPGITVGIGWGRTLRLSLRSVDRRPVHPLSVVSLLGGLTKGSVLNAYETAFHLADLFGAECFYVAGPVFADTGELRDLLLRQGLVREALERARRVDVALVSAGSLSADATMLRLGLLGEGEAAELRRLGAVGDLCCHWIDGAGRLVDHPLNGRVLAISPGDLAAVETVILASGGPDKVPVLRGALALGMVDVLVTDAATASALLDDGDARGRSRSVQEGQG